MKISGEMTLGEVVTEDYRAAAVFESFGVDFFCKGNQTLHQVCETKGIELTTLEADIKLARENKQADENDYKIWGLDKLATHIEQKHHKYVEQQTVIIKEYLIKICEAHSKNHTELLEVQKLFNVSTGEFVMHMKKEEFMLFPFIKRMVKAKNNNEKVNQPHFGSVKTYVEKMMHEHDNEGEHIETISKITQNYKIPADACATYKACLASLKEFEQDLHLHIHLENNILFPKAIELEENMFN